MDAVVADLDLGTAFVVTEATEDYPGWMFAIDVDAANRADLDRAMDLVKQALTSIVPAAEIGDDRDVTTLRRPVAAA